jgi:hypothetical protein
MGGISMAVNPLGKGPRFMRRILLLLALATLAACSQTVHVGGEGEYYQGIVPPR